jgi:hypothetical protein
MNLLESDETWRKDVLIEGIRQGACSGGMERFPRAALAQGRMKVIQQRHGRCFTGAPGGR